MDNFRGMLGSGGSWDLQIPEISREELRNRTAGRKRQKTRHAPEDCDPTFSDDDGFVADDTSPGLAPLSPRPALNSAPWSDLGDDPDAEASPPAPGQPPDAIRAPGAAPLEQIRKNTEPLDRRDFVLQWRADFEPPETSTDDAPSIHSLESDQADSQGTQIPVPRRYASGLTEYED